MSSPSNGSPVGGGSGGGSGNYGNVTTRASSPSVVLQWSSKMSGLSWGLLNPFIADGDNVDSWMAETGDHYIMKADLQVATADGVQSKLQNRTCMLTADNWIEVPMHDPVDPPLLPSPQSPAIIPASAAKEARKKIKPLDEIHSVEKEPAGPANPYPHAFRICFFSGSASSVAKAGFGKFKRLLQVGSTFEDFLKSKVVRCHSAEECDQWITVFHGLLRNRWQRKFEASILPEPEIYKRHSFVIKDHNDRLIVLSDFWFYNIEVTYKPTLVKSTKWAIPVTSLLLVLQVKGDVPLMRITFDAEEARKQTDLHHRSKEKGELRGDKGHTFQFRTASERQRFVSSMEAAYWQQARKRLKTGFADK